MAAMHYTKPSLPRLPSQLLKLEIDSVPASMASLLKLLQGLDSSLSVSKAATVFQLNGIQPPVKACPCVPCMRDTGHCYKQAHAQSCVTAVLAPIIDTLLLPSPDRAPLRQLLGRTPAPTAQRALLQRRQLILHIAALQSLKLALQAVAGAQLRSSVLVSACFTSPPQPPLEDHAKAASTPVARQHTALSPFQLPDCMTRPRALAQQIVNFTQASGESNHPPCAEQTCPPCLPG